jgi:ABC-type Zn uptake system ZnuABC Zn-binding protein ZnuA
MHERIDTLAPRVVAALKPVDPGAARQFEREVRDVKRRIAERVEWVKAEVAKLKRRDVP